MFSVNFEGKPWLFEGTITLNGFYESRVKENRRVTGIALDQVHHANTCLKVLTSKLLA